MIRKFVQINRKIGEKYLELSRKLFGRIDNCEDYFNEEMGKLDKHDKTIIELGGTWRPLFGKNNGFHYVGIDIDKDFKWHELYDQYYCNSVEDSLSVKGDIIVSKYLIEHVADNRKTFDNIGNWLNPGGSSIHLFPLKNHPFSIVNRIVGNGAARKLIPLLRPGTEAITGYPAFYNMCSSNELKKYLSEKGFKYKMTFYFGAEDYFGFFFPFVIIVHFFNWVSRIFKLNFFASNVVLEIYK